MFRAIPPHIAINGILGMCNSIFNWYDADRSAKPKEIADYFVSSWHTASRSRIPDSPPYAGAARSDLPEYSGHRLPC